MNWLLLVLAGGFVGLDSTSFPQVMISRPLVATALAGLILGDAAAGAALGVILEIFALVVLPVGASRYPESGTAAAAASAAFVASGGTAADTPLLMMAALFALGWERVSGLTVVFGRQMNEKLVANVASAPGAEYAVVRGHLLALLLDFVRGAACVGVGAVTGLALLGFFGPLFAPDMRAVAGMIAVTACAMIGAGLALFGGWRERRTAFGIGVLCGLLLILAA